MALHVGDCHRHQGDQEDLENGNDQEESRDGAEDYRLYAPLFALFDLADIHDEKYQENYEKNSRCRHYPVFNKFIKKLLK